MYRSTCHTSAVAAGRCERMAFPHTILRPTQGQRHPPFPPTSTSSCSTAHLFDESTGHRTGHRTLRVLTTIAHKRVQLSRSLFRPCRNCGSGGEVRVTREPPHQAGCTPTPHLLHSHRSSASALHASPISPQRRRSCCRAPGRGRPGATCGSRPVHLLRLHTRHLCPTNCPTKCFLPTGPPQFKQRQQGPPLTGRRARAPGAPGPCPCASCLARSPCARGAGLPRSGSGWLRDAAPSRMRANTTDHAPHRCVMRVTAWSMMGPASSSDVT